MKTKRLFLFLISMVAVSSCSIYKSADRNNFESEAPTFKIKSLSKTECYDTSIADKAQHSRLITVIDDEFIWQHDVNEITYFESTDLKGHYCMYDVTFE